MKRTFVLMLLGIFLAATLSVFGQQKVDDVYRVWTSSSGKTVEGQLTEIGTDYVILKNGNGKNFSVKIAELSDTDRNYIKSFSVPETPSTVEAEPEQEAVSAKTKKSIEKEFYKNAGLASLIFYCGIILLFVSSIWVIVAGFQESSGWGVALLVTFFLGCHTLVSLIFACACWDKAKGPVLTWMLGMGLVILGICTAFMII